MAGMVGGFNKFDLFKVKQVHEGFNELDLSKKRRKVKCTVLEHLLFNFFDLKGSSILPFLLYLCTCVNTSQLLSESFFAFIIMS